MSTVNQFKVELAICISQIIYISVIYVSLVVVMNIGNIVPRAAIELSNIPCIQCQCVNHYIT